MNFLLCTNPRNLADALVGRSSATVEAEFGEICVPGSILTMAHHGPREGDMAPCAYPNGCASSAVETVGLSHVDLDTLGGCMALLGEKPSSLGFWELAQFVDLYGLHRLAQSGAAPEDVRRFHAFRAWHQKFHIMPSPDGLVIDVTSEILRAAEVVKRVLSDDLEFLTAGDALITTEHELVKDSFVEVDGGVIARISPWLVSHLFTDPFGETHQAVVAFRTTTGAISVSFADSPKGDTAHNVVRALWGNLAGGHERTAGSPRGERMRLSDIGAAVEAVRLSLR